MNFKLLSASLFSVVTLSTFLPSLTPAAKAVCIANDVGVKVAIRERNKPANQGGNVQQEIDDNCFGNTATTTGSQAAVGGDINQQRNVNVKLGPGHNPTGVKTPNLKFNNQIEVDVPALPSN